MRTIAVYGGSFDPPHIGHAMVCQWILWTGKADNVVLVPSFHHPLKGRKRVGFDFRLDLLRAMVKDISTKNPETGIRTVWTSDIEDGMQVPVYSYDMLNKLQITCWYPDMRMRFVIGSDILQETHLWYKWDEIQANYDPIILGREGYPSPVNAPTIPNFSSSEIRRLLSSENPLWKEMVTPSVRKMLPGPYLDGVS